MGGLLFGFDIAIITGAGPFLTETFRLNSMQEGWAYSSLLLLGMLFLVSETPRYLYLTGKKEKAINILHLISRDDSGPDRTDNPGVFGIIQWRYRHCADHHLPDIFCRMYRAGFLDIHSGDFSKQDSRDSHVSTGIHTMGIQCTDRSCFPDHAL